MQSRLRHSAGLGGMLGASGVLIASNGTFTDGTEIWRWIADDDEAHNWQHTLTPTGFDGTEGIDYYTPQEIE